MIWIIPQSLTSASALATAASTSDCIAASRICEQSLMRRSKRSRASCYLREWKAGRLTRLQSGLTSSLSLGKNFATEWISSQAAIRASRSQAPESDSAEKTLATSGPTSQMEFQFCDPGSAFSRMSKDTSASDSEKSSSIWASLVTRRRGEYSARLKSARPINASGSSSWPTVTANEDSYRIGGNSQQSKCLSAMARRGEMSWPTPQTSDIYNAANAERPTHRPQLRDVQKNFGLVAPASPSSDGSRPASWATPRTGKTTDENPETWAKRQAEGKVATMPLTAQVKAWATPEAKNQVGYQVGQDGTKWPRLGSQAQAWATPRAEHDSGRHRGNPDTLHSQIKAWGTPNARDWMGAPGQGCQERGGHRASLPGQIKKTENSGKLNPRWVETLMGLPVGWTMPTCASPVIPESTSCASSETASSPPSPSEPSVSS